MSAPTSAVAPRPYEDGIGNLRDDVMKKVMDLMARRAVLGSICVMDALLFMAMMVPGN